MFGDRRIETLFGIEFPILQAPMAGSSGSALAIAVSEAGGLGSLPCALLSQDQTRAEIARVRAATKRPLNLNFFCHTPPPQTEDRAWRERLAGYYQELSVDPTAAGANRTPFDEAACALVEETHPEVVSFHFGLPSKELRARVRATGAKIISSATTVEEARFLEAEGCDAVIAQGVEAGGHRGMFLTTDTQTQVGTMALVPQVVDAVKVPVIAAGGIGDARGIVAAIALGAAAVQLGTAYLFCPEAIVAHRAPLLWARDDNTALTNVFTGRPARGVVNRLMREVGPMSELAPPFPLAANALAPLRATGSPDFAPLWSGQAAALHRELPAGELTRRLYEEALALAKRLG